MSASTPQSRLQKIDPLTADNWIQWKQMITPCLKVLQVWDHVQSDESAAQPISLTADLAAWQVKDNLAVAQIMINISPSQLDNAGNQDGTRTARQIWVALHSVFVDMSMSARMSLQTQLQAYKMLPDVGVQDHINGLRRLTDKLKAANEPVSDSQLVAHLLRSMSEDYKDVVSAVKWQTGPNASTCTFEQVRQALLAKEVELKATHAESARTYALSRAAASNAVMPAKGGSCST